MVEQEIEILINKLHNAQDKKDIPEEIKILTKLAQHNYNEGNFEKSKILLKEILELNSNQININYYLALIEINLENYSRALIYLKKELKLEPNHFEAKQLLEKLQIKSNVPLVTITLFFINLIVFFFTFPEISFLQLIKYSISDSSINLFSSITSLFFHANLIHFIFNMFILVMFGLILEKNIGSLYFLLVYMISGIVGNIVEAYFSSGSFILGASAALFGLIGGIIMKEPLLNARLFGIIKVPIVLLFGGFFAISSLLNSFMLNSFNTGDIAHIMGFLCGILLVAIIYQETINIFYHWLIMFFGFWIIRFAIEKIIFFPILIQFFYSIFLILIASSMIYYSYLVLKNTKESVGK